MPALSKTTSSPPRQPRPSLFLGPPSRDASHISLPSVLLPGAQASSIAAPAVPPQRGPLLRQQSAFTGRPPSRDGVDSSSAALAPITSPLHRTRVREQQQHERETAAGQRHADHAEALWAEMQNTLEDVELSATNDAHVFGPEHTKALEELRMAQIALAQAWAKSEADEVEEVIPSSVVKGAKVETRKEGGTESGQAGSVPKTDPVPNLKSDGDGEEDILLARRRREANDRFFERVNNGVEDVVAKLEVVASAMRAVERESRDIWSESGDTTPTDVT
ncbi:MAG: Transcription initiation factor TFIID subunit 13 [Watsoniomyces obsoletus]|nr:MAG: Transcription initiation factor TFIID subunit 13 [Watsoniomyces obsoletus]